jgi:phosphopantothenoylcysteine synthetase/decarboxylase
VVRIDGVRRISNFSTGELGLMLANAFAAAGCEVVCFRSRAATTDLRLIEDLERVDFETNDELAVGLRSREADVILHAAALADFAVAGIYASEGRVLDEAKISSRAGGVTVRLEPAAKLILSLRDWFPTARIVGWKYELDGEREEALAAGRRQLAEARTDVCVVNGAAFGPGFGLLGADGSLVEVANKAELVAGLVNRAGAA